MNSGNYYNCHPDPIVMIASCLSDHYVQPIFDMQNEKSYCVYLSCLAEIIDWATEFYHAYYLKLDDWKNFENSIENVYQAPSQYDFLIAWGKTRVKEFLNMYSKQIGLHNNC